MRCLLLTLGGSATLQVNAATALGWFLANHGFTKEFNSASMLELVTTSLEGEKHYVEQMTNIYEFAQDVLLQNEGQTIRIGSVAPFKSFLNKLTMPNWWFTLGEASGVAAAEVKVMKVDGLIYYEIKSKYRVYDYYDWDVDDDRPAVVPFFPNKMLGRLHYAGMAQSYFQHGEYEKTAYWVYRD